MTVPITEFMLNLLKSASKATGADFSKHKGLWSITDSNLPLLRLVMDFIILRAGYGGADGKTYTDPRFEENYAKAIKFLPAALRGSYWYFSSAMSWTVQYDHFARLVRDKDIHFLVLDFEEYYNTKVKGFALGAVYFLEKLEQDFPDRKIFIYANRYTYDAWLSLYTKGADRFPYWIAQYPWRNWWDTFTEYFKNYWIALVLGEEKKPTLPYARRVKPDDWELWQIGEKTKIGQELGFAGDDLDFNISRRSKEDFFEFITGRPYGEPEPTDPTDPGLPTDHPDLGAIKEAFLVFSDSYIEFGNAFEAFGDVLDEEFGKID